MYACQYLNTQKLDMEQNYREKQEMSPDSTMYAISRVNIHQ